MPTWALQDGVVWHVGDKAKCLNCGKDVVCIGIERDEEYGDYTEIYRTINVPKFDHVKGGKHYCDETGGTGAYPNPKSQILPKTALRTTENAGFDKEQCAGCVYASAKCNLRVETRKNKCKTIIGTDGQLTKEARAK